MKIFVSALAGFTFALGLGLGGMTQPHVVQGFLDVTGNWDPRLLGVMFGALAVHAVSYRLITRRPSPLLDVRFHVPDRRDIDRRLILGAAIFGVGWGLAGICPGPGLVGLVSGQVEFLLFITSMLAGMKLWQVLERRKGS
jgi:uncharacterized membrane protein YedE/YeeE